MAIKKYVLKKTASDSVRKEIDENKFVIKYKELLNESQFEAVSAIDGAYLVIAGAGTGKTRTLVYRVARLIELGYDPRSILLLTFTRKAAREMMNRAAVLLDNRCAKVNGGTFHSFANLTLRKYSKFLNLNPNFTILDQSDSEDVLNLIRGQLKLHDKKQRFPNKATIYKILSLGVNTEKSVSEIIEREYPHFEKFTQDILKIKSLYETYKYKNGLLDYDDLLVYLRNFLADFGPGAKALLSTIRFVMVDEYQDTNKLQADIVKGLTQINHNVMVVGDDSQSIYSFRGANFKNIMEFPRLFPDAKIIKLEENYRSTQEILNFANQIIERAEEKYTKFLFTRKSSGELPAVISAKNENLQARFIVERVLDLREEGVPLNEIAVLFRSSFMSFELEIELNKANIPYQKFGGMKFVETAHIKDLLAFLRIAENPRDMVSWYRVLLLHEGIGPKTAQKIMDDISSGALNLKNFEESAVASKYKKSLVKLLNLLKNISENYELPADKLEVALQYYYPIFKEKYDDFNKRAKDLEIFSNIVQNYKDLQTLLTDMALEPPQDSLIDVEAEGKENEYLTLSTIHSAKGLEWHTVFIIHAVEGFFPSGQSYDSPESLEEERRLMYVAVTRAKQNLYICYPMHLFDRRTGFTISKPSRFIAEISQDFLEEWLLEEEY
jgi:DNA helicase-2/ATP-dependent DNA helicase PcrA